MWKSVNADNSENFVAFSNPDDPCDIWLLEPNWEIIKHLKETSLNGGTVIVWSAGGWDWALEVVKVLELEHYVDAVLTKPHRYVDDLHCDEFMGTWRKVSLYYIQTKQMK